MENASKALIIAGAILLSIVLITLGVLIIGRGQDAIDQTNIDDQVVSAWNQKWTKYEGDKVSGTTVNNLINEVLSSNALAVKNGEIEKVIRFYPISTSDIIIKNGYEWMTEGSTTIFKYSNRRSQTIWSEKMYPICKTKCYLFCDKF